MPAGARPLLTSLYSFDFDGSPSKRSRKFCRKRGDAGLVEREFARRQQPHLVHRIDAALGVDVECAQRLDLVVEQVDAVGQGAARWEEVDQPTAMENSPGE